MIILKEAKSELNEMMKSISFNELAEGKNYASFARGCLIRTDNSIESVGLSLYRSANTNVQYSDKSGKIKIYVTPAGLKAIHDDGKNVIVIYQNNTITFYR
jgi:hypothetical protein